MRFKNFSIWRGKLPHWRADDVRYFVTFRHRRDLEPWERQLLFRRLMRPNDQEFILAILCVGTDRTEMIFELLNGKDGRPAELSQIVERSKTKAGKEIIKKTGERFPPFYNESYDRIIRDEMEMLERWQTAFDMALDEEETFLWFRDMPGEDLPGTT